MGRELTHVTDLKLRLFTWCSRPVSPGTISWWRVSTILNVQGLNLDNQPDSRCRSHCRFTLHHFLYHRESMFSKFARSPLPQAPVDDPDPTIESQKISSRQVKLPPGRKFTLIGGVVGSLFVLILNLSVTLASLNQPKGTGEAANGLRVLYQGSCSKASKVNVVLHLFINIFSSVLLAASNYSMQCLSAPTRADVDRAHAKKKWMDIGIPSVHNLSKIPKTRAMLWFLLLVSSVPLHLL